MCSCNHIGDLFFLSRSISCMHGINFSLCPSFNVWVNCCILALELIKHYMRTVDSCLYCLLIAQCYLLNRWSNINTPTERLKTNSVTQSYNLFIMGTPNCIDFITTYVQRITFHIVVEGRFTASKTHSLWCLCKRLPNFVFMNMYELADWPNIFMLPEFMREQNIRAPPIATQTTLCRSLHMSYGINAMVWL
jgi:hypothetical protein